MFSKLQRILIIVLLFNWGTSFSNIQPGLPLIRNFSPENYNGGIQNWQIGQDSEGLIYVANNFGLLQYDGNEWRRYEVSGATKMRSMAISKDGRIYAGSQGDFGFFESDSSGKMQYHSLKNLVVNAPNEIDETWKTYSVNDKIYFCTFTGIYVYDKSKVDFIKTDNILDISFQSGNQIFTHIPERGLSIIDKNSFRILPGMEFFAQKYISGITPLDRDKTDHINYKKWHLGIFLRHPKTFQFQTQRKI